MAARRLAAGLRRAASESRPAGLLAGGALVLAATLVLVEIAALATEPTVGWDALAMWMYKARLFMLASAVELGPIAGQPIRHLDYPPLWPLQVDSFWVLTGELRDVPGKVAAGADLVAAVGVLFAVLRPRLGYLPAAGAALLLAASPLLLPQLIDPTEAGYADLPCGLLLLVAAALLTSDARDGPLLGLGCAALAALTKNEGLPFLIPAAAIAILRGGRPLGRWSRAWPAVAAPLAGVVAWALYARSHGYRSDLTPRLDLLSQPGPLAHRAVEIATYAVNFLGVAPDYAWLAAGVALALVGGAIHPGPAARIAALLVGWQLLSYAGAYLVSPYDLHLHMVTSFHRLLLQVAPMTILALGLCASAPGSLRAPELEAARRAPVISVEP